MNTITDFSPEAVIVDAGEFPTADIPLGFLKDCKKIVCCDGAANQFIPSGYIPWRIVGDGDSISPEFYQKFHDIIRQFPDQETNDQTKSVKYLASKGIRCIAIVGATGKREDHTLGNISLLVQYLKKGIEARIYTDYGVFIPIIGSATFYCEPGSQVSVFNFGATGMWSENLRYPLRDFHSWWEGTLNEASGSSFTIHAEGYYIVFLNYASSKK
ncbi:MAG: thiamine diphosphokinase [Muribaculaceae bacterium]|nr:thiamine diphosphokinase [Muribaculaceae bacterium]